MSEPFFSDKEVRHVLFMLGLRNREVDHGGDTTSYRVGKAVRDAIEEKLRYEQESKREAGEATGT